MIEGMRLRPVAEDELAELEGMFDDPNGIGLFNFGGFRDSTFWRKRWAEDRMLADDKSSFLVIDLDGEMLGFVSFAKRPTANSSHCMEFGICLLTAARGKGHGATAQLLLARYLFAHSPVHRIQAFTEVDNIAEQRSLEKAGYVREAVLRGLSFRDGAWRDEVLYRMLRSELPVDDQPDREPAEDRG
jgi:RimJ/RimL family protein N-acetyltransferase